MTKRGLILLGVIAAVSGMAVGGGFELMLACDMVTAAADARFGIPLTRRTVWMAPHTHGRSWGQSHAPAATANRCLVMRCTPE